MTIHCNSRSKNIEVETEAAGGRIGADICVACAAAVSGPTGSALLESIKAPVLLMQGNPRQVVTANRQALVLFGKELSEVEGHRGGEVFDCVLSFTEAGCGKDPGCEGCPIKEAIVDTFSSGRPHQGVAATLHLKKAGGNEDRLVRVSTEKVGELALVRVEGYNRTDQP